MHENTTQSTAMFLSSGAVWILLSAKTFCFVKIVKRDSMHFNPIDCHVMHICSFTRFPFLFFFVNCYTFFFTKKRMSSISVLWEQRERERKKQILSANRRAICSLHLCLCEIHAERLFIYYTHRETSEAERTTSQKNNTIKTTMKSSACTLHTKPQW